MSRYWSDLVKRLTPYVPGEQPVRKDLVKLNTNENPYPPSPRVMQAIAATGADALRRYPDPESTALKQAFADRYSLAPAQVFVGNGSDEVLAHVFQGLLKHDRPLYFPDITYSFYPVWCELYGIEYRNVALTPDFAVDVAAYPAENGGIIIANPNAPTGRLLPLKDIRALLDASRDSVVVIDEAYIDFGGESAAVLIDDYDNLLVIQTLSKSRALAGLRVGVALGSSELVEALERVKNSFNSYPLDVVAQQAAKAALEDQAYYDDCCRRVVASRERLTAEMTALGFEIIPSTANFILATHPGHAAGRLFSQLRERGIVVRYFDKPRIDNYLRISIGTDEDCDALLVALAELLAPAGPAADENGS
jgi:histidinol-phosphate aminotransferase